MGYPHCERLAVINDHLAVINDPWPTPSKNVVVILGYHHRERLAVIKPFAACPCLFAGLSAVMDVDGVENVVRAKQRFQLHQHLEVA